MKVTIALLVVVGTLLSCTPDEKLRTANKELAEKAEKYRIAAFDKDAQLKELTEENEAKTRALEGMMEGVMEERVRLESQIETLRQELEACKSR